MQQLTYWWKEENFFTDTSDETQKDEEKQDFSPS